MQILVLGSGAREHAIIHSIWQEGEHELFAAPGNAGIAKLAQLVALDPKDPEQVLSFAEANSIDLVVIGPEAPLLAGVADKLRQAGIPVFGPDKAAAQIEGSKVFAKEVMAEAAVPTGAATLVRTESELQSALSELSPPYVVKANGVAAGKGVLVTEELAAALEHGRYWLEVQGSVLVEEFLAGEEVSLFFVTDGKEAYPLAPARDYKRLQDDDLGPNTGGMGAYTPLPWLVEHYPSEQEFIDQIRNQVALPVIKQLANRGTPFIGLLYCELILTSTGAKVIEFNARFGDPETQVILPRLKTKLSELLYAAAIGELAKIPRPSFSDEVAVTVVLASAGYPADSSAAVKITGLAEAESVIGVNVYHAATAVDSKGDLVSAGGRVLNIVAIGTDRQTARQKAYQAIELIEFPNVQFRKDIAK